MSLDSIKYALNSASAKQKEMRDTQAVAYEDFEHPLAAKIKEDLGDVMKAFLYAHTLKCPYTDAILVLEPVTKNSLEIKLSGDSFFSGGLLYYQSFVLTKDGYKIRRNHNNQNKIEKDIIQVEDIIQIIVDRAANNGPDFLAHFIDHLTKAQQRAKHNPNSKNVLSI